MKEFLEKTNKEISNLPQDKLDVLRELLVTTTNIDLIRKCSKLKDQNCLKAIALNKNTPLGIKEKLKKHCVVNVSFPLTPYRKFENDQHNHPCVICKKVKKSDCDFCRKNT